MDKDKTEKYKTKKKKNTAPSFFQVEMTKEQKKKRTVLTPK